MAKQRVRSRGKRRSIKKNNVRPVKRSRRSSMRSRRSSMRSRRSAMRSRRSAKRSRRSTRRMRGGMNNTALPIAGVVRSAPAALGTKYSGKMPSAWNVRGDNFRRIGREKVAQRQSVGQLMDAMSNELVPYDREAAEREINMQALRHGTRRPTRRESLNQNLQIAGEEFGSIFSQAQQNFISGAQEAIANYAIPLGQNLMDNPQNFISMMMLLSVISSFLYRNMYNELDDPTQRQPLP